MRVSFVQKYNCVYSSSCRYYSGIMDTHQTDRVFHNDNVRFAYISQHSILNIRKSATNMFVTFSVNDVVLFSRSAGSVSSVKKERRLNSATSKLGESFNRFVRYYIRTGASLSVFSNITVQFNAPMRIVKSFMYITRNFLRSEVRKHNRNVLLSVHKQYRALARETQNNIRRRQALDFLDIPVYGNRLLSSRSFVTRICHTALIQRNIRYTQAYAGILLNSLIRDVMCISVAQRVSVAHLVDNLKCSLLGIRYLLLQRNTLREVYTVYMFLNMFSGRLNTAHTQCSRFVAIYSCNTYGMLLNTKCLMRIKHRIDYFFLRNYTLLRFAFVNTRIRQIDMRVANYTTDRLDRRESRASVFRIRSSSILSICAAGTLVIMLHRYYRSFVLYGKSACFVICAYSLFHTNKLTRSVAIYGKYKYAEFCMSRAVFFLQLLATLFVRNACASRVYNAFMFPYIRMCRIVQSYSNSQRQTQFAHFFNENLNVMQSRTQSTSAQARRPVMVSKTQSFVVKRDVAHTMWYSANRLRRMTRLRHIIHNKNKQALYKPGMLHKHKVSAALCSLGIRCFVNKSTQPFNGCRSSTKFN